MDVFSMKSKKEKKKNEIILYVVVWNTTMLPK